MTPDIGPMFARPPARLSTLWEDATGEALVGDGFTVAEADAIVAGQVRNRCWDRATTVSASAEEADPIERLFPLDINGDPVDERNTDDEFGMDVSGYPDKCEHPSLIGDGRHWRCTWCGAIEEDTDG